MYSQTAQVIFHKFRVWLLYGIKRYIFESLFNLSSSRRDPPGLRTQVLRTVCVRLFARSLPFTTMSWLFDFIALVKRNYTVR